MTESVALLHGALFASEMEVYHAIFESNAFSLIQSIHSEAVGGDWCRILNLLHLLSASVRFSI